MHDIYRSYRYAFSWGDERNASGDQRVSISCVKWTACARHAATLAIVVFHVRHSFCWSPCHKTWYRALRHTFHAIKLDLVVFEPSDSLPARPVLYSASATPRFIGGLSRPHTTTRSKGSPEHGLIFVGAVDSTWLPGVVFGECRTGRAGSGSGDARAPATNFCETLR